MYTITGFLCPILTLIVLDSYLIVPRASFYYFIINNCLVINKIKMEQQRKRVEDQMTKMVEEIDKTYLRKMQVSLGYQILNYIS